MKRCVESLFLCGLLVVAGAIRADSGSDNSTGQYVLPNDWEGARSRLQLLEKANEPHTLAQLQKVNIGKGWRCLDVGAGLGGMSRWLADKVGPDGVVDALDANTTFLDSVAGSCPNVQVIEANLLEWQHEHCYDFILARDVMMHIPQRLQVIEKLVQALKPGGILMVEDVALHRKGMPYRYFSNAPEANRLLEDVMLQLEQGGHMSFCSAYDNAELLRQAGLQQIAGEISAHLFSCNSAEAGLLAQSLQQVKPLMMQKGFNEALFDWVIKHFADPSMRAWGFLRVTTVGVKKSSDSDRA